MLSEPSPGESPATELPVAGEVVTGTPADDAPALSIDDSEQTLHPNFIGCERLVGWIVAAVLGSAGIVGCGLWLWFSDQSFSFKVGVSIIGVILLGVFCWFVHYWPPIDYRYRSFRVSVTGIQIRKGVLWRSVMDVPKSRVQHTDVNQGPIERKYGLAHLVIHTAGTISASVKLEGLGYDTAVALRDHLVESGSDDAV